MSIKTIKSFNLTFQADTVSSVEPEGSVVVSSIVFISNDFFTHLSNYYAQVITSAGTKHYVLYSNLRDFIS
jgi:hypothetical protein